MNADKRSILHQGRPVTRLPALDLARARRFYSERLGLDPFDERPGGLLYRCGGAEFVVFQSAGASPGTFTQMTWEVDDIDQVVTELRSSGVLFEEVELPAPLGGGPTEDGITEVEGNYPTTGTRSARGAWFQDSEGNLLALEAPLR